MPIITQGYRRDRLFPILSPLDGRKGQLAADALSSAGATLDLSLLANVVDLQAGDAFFFISDDDELSGNIDAEVVTANTEEFVIASISSASVAMDHAWTSEPNAASKFFEYKVLRRIPQDAFTFPRVDQLDFSSGATFFAVNGAEVAATWTNPSGESVLVTFAGGTVLFIPLGSGRWRAEPKISIDAHVEVVIPDTAEDVELRLSNLDVLSDTPLWAIGNDGSEFFAWLKGRMRALEQMMGLTFIDGLRGVDAKIVISKPSKQQAQAGSLTEILINLVTGPKEEPFDLNGAVVYFESRDVVNITPGPFVQAEVVSDGLVRVLIPAASLKAGVLNCQMVIYAGDVPEDVIRTNTFTLTVLS